jgi:hypothetical protein
MHEDGDNSRLDAAVVARHRDQRREMEMALLRDGEEGKDLLDSSWRVAGDKGEAKVSHISVVGKSVGDQWGLGVAVSRVESSAMNVGRGARGTLMLAWASVDIQVALGPTKSGGLHYLSRPHCGGGLGPVNGKLFSLVFQCFSNIQTDPNL